MGFLDNLALRSIHKRMRPFMRQDERFIDYEIAQVDGVKNVRVVLSNRALYFIPTRGDEAVRVPYETIIHVDGIDKSTVGIKTTKKATLISVQGAPRTDLQVALHNQVQALIRFEGEVTTPRGELYAICRPLEEGKPATWVYVGEGGVGLDDRSVQEALRSQLGDVAERVGIPLQFPQGE